MGLGAPRNTGKWPYSLVRAGISGYGALGTSISRVGSRDNGDERWFGALGLGHWGGDREDREEEGSELRMHFGVWLVDERCVWYAVAEEVMGNWGLMLMMIDEGDSGTTYTTTPSFPPRLSQIRTINQSTLLPDPSWRSVGVGEVVW